MPSPISWAHSWPYLAAFLAFGYALGSIPFGLPPMSCGPGERGSRP